MNSSSSHIWSSRSGPLRVWGNSCRRTGRLFLERSEEKKGSKKKRTYKF